MNQAVVLGSNYYIGLSIIRCLGRENIDVVAMDYQVEKTYGARSKYLSKQFIVPHYTNEKELLDCLLAYGKKQALKPVLFPTADAYVAFMDRYLDQLKTYYLIPMTHKGLWTNIMDKDKLRALCIEHDVLIPETITPDELDWSTFDELIGFPCLLKPNESPAFVNHYRKKMFVCHHRMDLEEAIKMTNKDGFKMLIQRMIVGFDSNVCTYDAYLNQNSKVTHSMTCQKLRQFPIHFGASCYTVQRYIPEIEKIGQSFLENVSYKGFAEIEFKRDDRNQKFYLIEVNTRTTTLNEMLSKVGINFPFICYQELIGQEISTEIVTESTNIAFRYHLEDLIASYQYIKIKELSIADYLRSLRRKKVYAIWSKCDIRPYLSYLKDKILRK